MHHSFPLSSEEALEAQETHQLLTHNYLKELGESSCPQIIVKLQIPREQHMEYAHTHTRTHRFSLYTTTVDALALSPISLVLG